MARTTRGNIARKRHKKVLKLTKGFRGSLSKLYRPAKQALLHALSYSFRDRRKKKQHFRQLWIARIKAGLIPHNLSYSAFIAATKKSNILINRKIYAMLVVEHGPIFDHIVKTVTKT